jgi:hypothetical protein
MISTEPTHQVNMNQDTSPWEGQPRWKHLTSDWLPVAALSAMTLLYGLQFAASGKLHHAISTLGFACWTVVHVLRPPAFGWWRVLRRPNPAPPAPPVRWGLPNSLVFAVYIAAISLVVSGFVLRRFF